MTHRFLILILLVTFNLFPVSGIRKNKTILILHSYNQGLSWTDNLNRSISRRLGNDTLILADIRLEYMDTKYDESEISLKNFTRFFLEKYKTTKFDLIISTDNAAFNFLTHYRDSLINRPPVIFCGLNYVNRVPPHFTGVMEDIDIQSNIRTILDLHPEFKKLFVIVDRTITGNKIKNNVNETIARFFPNLNHEFLTDYTLDELKKKLSTLTTGDIVLLTTFNSDRNKTQISYDHILELVKPYCNVPIYGTWDFYLEKGIVGGKITKANTQGRLAAKMALKVLNGASIDTIPVVTGPTEFVFDNLYLQKFKIATGKLPANATIINTPYSFVKENLVIVLLTSLIFLLMLSVIMVYMKLFRKEKQIRKKEQIFLQELKHKSVELEKALQLAEKSNQLKTAFLSNLSHEIRTPMNAIVGFSDLITANYQDKKLEEYVSIIRASSSQLLSIINDIIEMSMIETDQVQLHFGTTNVNKTINEVYSSFAVTLDSSSRVAIRKNLTLSDSDTYIVTDEVKLRQILSNLISNAFKFTESGYIEVGYVVAGDFLEFYVRDTGIGIDSKYHEEIFERFRRVEHPDIFLFRGLGIGLTLSQSFVKLLGGSIWLDSEPGKGSTFYFTIPYNKVIKTNDLSPDQENPDLKNNVILICEDDENNLFYFKELFSKTNTYILWAKNGKEAVKACRENIAIDLVLMDLKMPEMNGWEATKIIKSIRPDLPVIAQTAHALSLEVSQLSNKGFDDYVTKPIKRNELFDKISRFIHKIT